MHQLTAPINEDIASNSIQEGSNGGELDHYQSRPTVAESALPRVQADALARAVAGVGLDTLRERHLALAMAVIELAADAGAPLPWSHDDPTVALLRALAKLAITSPDATSSAAAGLIDQLHAAGATASTDH